MERNKWGFRLSVFALWGLVVGAPLAVGCSSNDAPADKPEPTSRSEQALDPACDPAAGFGSITRVLPANVTAEGFAPGPDGRTAIITHRSGGNYDLYLATRPETTGPFDWFSRLPGNVNSPADERAPWLSASGFRLFFHRQGVVGESDLFVAERTGLDQPFGAPSFVPGVNAPSFDEDPFLIPNEQRLYFTSHRGASVDLHVAGLVNGSYSQISSLTSLNSGDPEGRPVISSDERKIYFKSRRPGVYNDQDGDIFLAQRASTTDPFVNPTNVSHLNTSGIDFPVWLSADGCDLYFASNREAISKTTDGGLEVFHLYRGRRHAVPNQVTITVNVLGTGTVGAPFNCSVGGGTCSITRTFGQSLVVYASTQGYWTGVCEPNGARLSSDGILPFTLDGTCTVDFTSDGICSGAPIDDGNPCTVDSCHPVQGVVHAPAPAGTPCADIDVCNGTETCNGNGACTPGTPTGCGPGGPCQSDANCEVGLTCAGGVCTCGPGSSNPLCFPSHCSNGVTDGNETDVDCGGACADCGPDEICSADPDCADGLACVNGRCSCVPDCEGRCDGPDGCGGTCRGGPGATCCSGGNSCQDELACVNGTCMPDDCFLNPVAAGCGYEGAPCGPTCTLHPTCTQQSDCPSGFICPEGNGWRYAVPGLRVCERPEWQCDSTHPPGGCGGPLSNCGVCDCVPECAGKNCGDTDLDDGCGGRCTAVCDGDDVGCELDADCQAGSVCRASRCRPADPCASPTKILDNCGGVGSLCGPCPNLATVLRGQPTCGTDPATGASFGSCPGGMFCNAAGHCAALETTPNIFVPNADGSQREVIPEPIPAAENGVGIVAGQFGVTDRGGASYTIPIVVPPGRSIMPSLALRYTSSAGNGALGAGWSLDGLSNITRCAKIYALDGYNHPPIGENNDAFCLDGQRLVRLENGDYRTAVDTFARIRPVFPVGELRPDSFTLHAKDGRILTYGGLGAQGRVGQRGISTWALSRVEDRSGNFMRITYRAGLENVDGIAEMVPHVITYTGHGDIDGDREVEFVYDQTRPDQYFRENIVPASRSFRLNQILVRAQQRFVRQYNLSYDPALDTSQLTSIEECVAPGICKLPTTFDYVPEEARFATREGGGLHDCAFNGCITPPKISPLGFTHWRQNVGLVPSPGWGGRDWMATTSNDTYITRVSPTLAGPSFVVSFVPVVGAFASMALNILGAIGDRQETTTYRYDIDVLNGLAQRTGIANRKRYSTRHVVASDPTNGDNEQVLYYDSQIVRTGRQVTIECTDVQYEMCTYEVFAVTSPRLWYVDVDGNGVQDKLFCGGDKLYLTLSRAGETGIAEVPVDGSVQTSDANLDAPDLCRVDCGDEQIYNRLYGEGVVGVGCSDDRPFSVTLDVDGDGTSNLVFYSRLHGWFYVAYDGDLHLKNEVFAGVTLSATRKNYVAALDANGDGLRDILGLPDKASAPDTKAVILYNSGAGFTQQNLDAEGDLGFAPSLVPFVIDYDRDGTEELIEPTALYQDESELPHHWRVRRISDGRISEEMVDSLVGGPGTLADFDGDGDLDAYTQAASRDPEFENHAYLHRGQGRHKGLLKSVTDGLGHRVDIAYDEPGHPDPNRPSDFALGLGSEICKWPVRCPTRVNHALVTTHVESHSTGGQSVTERTAKYHYGLWLTDMGGYGALGFLNRYVVETDGSGNELGRTRYEYVQPTPGPRTPPYFHPTAGLVKQVIVQGPFLSSRIGAGYTPRTVTTRDWITQTSADGRPFPVLQQETTLSGVLDAYISDPSGNPVRVEGTSAHSSRTVVNTVDSYGNITDQIATEFDLEGRFPDEQTNIDRSESSMIVHRRFEPTQAEVDAWLIGLVKSEDVTSNPRCHGLVNCASFTKTRHRTNEYDPETGLLRLTHRQPGDPNLDQQILFERDAFGNVFSETKSDASGNTRIVTMGFDTRGMFPITVTAVGSGISHTTQVRFDDRFGNLTARADPNGIDETWSYDELGIVRHHRGPEGERTQRYDAVQPFTSDLGLPIDAVIRFVANETGGEEQTEDFNAFGQSVRRSTTGPHGVLVSTESIYDERHRLVQKTRPHREGNGTQGYLAFEYDLLDRVITQTNPDGSQILKDDAPFTTVQDLSLFDDAGPVQVARIVDANGNATVKVTNRAGHPVYVYDAAWPPRGSVTFYYYGSFDLLHKISAGDGESYTEIELYRDAFGRLTEVIDEQHGGSARTIYNGLDEVVETRDAAERLTRNFYDSIGRLEHVEDEDGTTQFIYDGDGSQANTIGRLVETISPTGQRVTHGYEPRENGFNRGFENRVTRQLNAAGNGPGSGGVRTLETRFTYDGNSRLERLEYPEGAAGSRLALEYGYDGFGHNIRVSDALNPSTVHWELVETDPDQGLRIHKERLGSAQCESTLGTTTTRSYHPLRGTPTSIGTDCGNMEIQRLTYDHDPGGNLTLRGDDIANTSESFDYDPEDRLTHVNGVETYRYLQEVGQLHWQEGVGNYTYDTSTLLSTAGDNEYAPHDDVGNITWRSGAFVPFGSQSIEYTTFNLPRTVVNGSDDTTNFSYDAAGVRAVKQTAEYAQFYAGDLFQRRETATDTLHRAIIYAGGRAIAQITQRETNNSISTETRYLHDDHLGSIQAITTESGSLESRRRYSPFGRKQVSGSSDVPYGFTGHEEDDDLGLVNMKGRMYDPYLGQFLTADPIIQSPYGTGINRFAYVRNSPTNYVDPSGFQLAEAPVFDGGDTSYVFRDDPLTGVAPNGPTEVIGAGASLLTATNAVLQMYQRSNQHISTAVTQTDVRAIPSSDSALRPSGATSSTPVAPDGVDGARTAANEDWGTPVPYDDVPEGPQGFGPGVKNQILEDPAFHVNDSSEFWEGALDIATTVIPTPAMGFKVGKGLLELAKRAGKGAPTVERLVIGRLDDLAKPGTLKPGERALSWPSKMPDVKAEWKINSGLLRQEMKRGLPIRDASPGNKGGMFLNAERNLLRSHGWSFDASTNLWMPPVP